LLETLLQSPIDNSSEEVDIHLRQQEILLEILGRCSGRLLKHIQRFINELKNAGCLPGDQYKSPTYISGTDQTEVLRDIQRFGRRCPENHKLYMQTCKDRLNQLRGLSFELARTLGGSNLPKMMVLAETAYDVRRSSSFRQFLQSNLQQTKRPEVVISFVGGILERLGKMSRFYRAATTFSAVGMKLLKRNMSIRIQGVPAPKVRITELSSRTTAQLRLRGGCKYASSSERQLQGMISRWPKYRLHSEMQLLIFYQENPDLLPRDGYVGCDKLSCYLCHSFITNHGQLEVKGCHQSLYSLWTVPDLVTFENEERAEVFRNTLRALCEDLECKMTAMRNPQIKPWKNTPNNESIANLSRLSLPLTISMIEQGSTLQATRKEILPEDQQGYMEGEILAASRTSLAMIPEVPLLECSQENAELEQAEQLERIPPMTEIHRVKAKLELDAMGSDSVLADAISKSQIERGEKRQKEMQRAKRPSKHRHQHLRPNEGRIRRQMQNRRIEEKVPPRRAPKHEQSGFVSRNKTRHWKNRKQHGRTERQDGRQRWCNKDQSRRPYQPKLGSTKANHSNQGILSLFWHLGTILVGGCFGESRTSG
jgi:hypothetical protein